MLYIENKKRLLDNFNQLDKKLKQSQYRNIRMVLKILVKVSKMMEIYPVTDSAFDEFIENTFETLNKVFNTLDFFAVTVKKVGFYYQEKKLKLMDEGERKFRSVFVVNDVREICFKKGITQEEIRDFFVILSKTLDYTGNDYDLNTLMWSYNINNIGLISFFDMGDFEQPTIESLTFLQQSKVDIRKMSYIQLHEMVDLVRDFDNVGKERTDVFNEYLKNHSSEYILHSYLKKISLIILSNQSKSQAKYLLNQISDFTLQLLKQGNFFYAVLFFKNVLNLHLELKKLGNVEYFKLLENLISFVNTEDFIEKMFKISVLLDSKQIEGFGELLTILSKEHFEKVFLMLVEHKSKDVRISCLKGIAKNFKDVTLAKKLIENEDWHVVRNLLYLFHFTFSPEFLPLVRNIMNHEQKQIRIEASKVLAEQDADENLQYWKKAIKSPDIEVRAIAVESLVKVKGLDGKPVLDSLLRFDYLKKLDIEEVSHYLKTVIRSRKIELFDLVANVLFIDKEEIRLKAIEAILLYDDLTQFSRQILKKINSDDFIEMKQTELEAFLQLITKENFYKLLPALERIFKLEGSFFRKSKYRKFKETVIKYIATQKSIYPKISQWLKKGYEKGNKETKEIIKQYM